MNGRYETDDLDEPIPAPADREISLGTGAMLGIFFALVLVCGAFFGFGYSMGHKSTPVMTAGAATVDGDAGGAAPAAEVGGTKPALGGSEAAPAVVVKPSVGSGTRAGVAAATAVAGAGAGAGRRTLPETTAGLAALSASAARTGPKPSSTESAGASAGQVTAAVSAAPQSASLEAAPAATPGAASVYVQISAVSHQEDAQLLTTALKRRGYEPTVRHSPQDQLLHVQLGPFANKKEADAMRQRLSADGYNAILK